MKALAERVTFGGSRRRPRGNPSLVIRLRRRKVNVKGGQQNMKQREGKYERQLKEKEDTNNTHTYINLELN